MAKSKCSATVMQAIAKNDVGETQWNRFLESSEVSHLIDIFEDLRISEEMLCRATTPLMMQHLDFMCAQPMSVAAARLAIGLAVVRLRAELIARASPGTASDAESGLESDN